MGEQIYILFMILESKGCYVQESNNLNQCTPREFLFLENLPVRINKTAYMGVLRFSSILNLDSNRLS